MRPQLTPLLTLVDFNDFYWTKWELITFCKEVKLPYSGSKQDLVERIQAFLGGQAVTISARRKASSRFDWQRAPLSLETVITDNYSTTRQVRLFFEVHLGMPFSVNVAWMDWMKNHVGFTLSDAIQAWHSIQREMATRTAPTDIAPQFEFNRYMRAFRKNNPTRSREEGVYCWKIKRSLRGPRVYDDADVLWLNRESNSEWSKEYTWMSA